MGVQIQHRCVEPRRLPVYYGDARLGERTVCKACRKVDFKGTCGRSGQKECKKPVLFPKIVFLYDEKLHGPGGELEDVFEAGVHAAQRQCTPTGLA